MHNVKKTPASKLHEAIEEKKRTEKITLYIANRDQIFSKRDKNEFDEEILALTGELLKKNPDVYTFWNIRRKTVTILVQQILDNRNEENADEKCTKAVGSLFDDELLLTQEALLANPKSYGAWHHRFWTFQNHPSANMEAELALCEKALSFDPRNFHCWDHRRLIATLAKFTPQDELAFCDKLISSNPSNYSAWHYRATLLPKLQPDMDADHPYKMPISEQCLVNEVEKIKNVCCVNSEDQTAWTYCRWLCEAACSQDGLCTRNVPRQELSKIVDFCEEMVKIDPDNPWEVTALARCKFSLAGKSPEIDKTLKALYEKVMKLDPQRSGMYKDLLRLSTSD